MFMNLKCVITEIFRISEKRHINLCVRDLKYYKKVTIGVEK